MKENMTLARFEEAINELKANGIKGPYHAWINTPNGLVLIKGRSAKKLWKKCRREWKK